MVVITMDHYTNDAQGLCGPFDDLNPFEDLNPFVDLNPFGYLSQLAVEFFYRVGNLCTPNRYRHNVAKDPAHAGLYTA